MENIAPPNQPSQFSPDALRAAAEQTADPVAVFEAALARLSTDSTALLEDDVLDALRTIRQKDEAAYERLTVKASGQKTRLDKLTRPSRDGHDDSAAGQLINIAKESCRFAHNADGRGVAIVEFENLRKVWYINSSEFGDWLRSIYFQKTDSGIADLALGTAVCTLAAIGKHAGDEVEVHMRCAKYGDDYYIDVCDDKWQVVCVGKTGWSLLSRSPILFTRTKNMRPLPIPNCAPNLDSLWMHINVPEDRRLEALTWLLDSYRPDTPFPVLEITGEHGTAKSTTQWKLRDLTDPNKVALRGCPKSVEDIYVGAANNWVCSFENLSYLSPEEQDAFCTLATGGGFATRQHYTNGDEHVLEAKRPVMLNGINAVATQPDLIDRTVSIEAQTIPADQRKDEQTLKAEWAADYPGIFVGLLDLFAQALAALPGITLTDKQRMADYQLLGEAVAQVRGHAPGHFSMTFCNRVAEGADRSLETYGVAAAVEVLLGPSKNCWEGTILELKMALESLSTIDRSNWPRSPRGLSGQLKRLAPGLRLRGIVVEHLGHGRGGSRVKLTFSPPEATQ
jgi:hypothetical protein